MLYAMGAGFVLGASLVWALVLFGPMPVALSILTTLGIFLVLSIFTTSGKGDRNYRE
jgi:hypothetical protein